MADPKMLRQTISKMVNDIIEKRYQDRKSQIEVLNLPPDKHDEKLMELEDTFQHEAMLIDLTYYQNISELDYFFKEFYDKFSQDCHFFNNKLTEPEIEEMFLDLIILLYKTKLKILDSSLEIDLRQQLAQVQDILHENARLIMWSQAQEKASVELMQALEKIFQPVLEDFKSVEIGLYTRHGRHRTSNNISDHPPSYIIGESGDSLDSLLMLNAGNEGSPDFGIDTGLKYLLWSALSSHYVQKSDRKNINVFLPDGDIATSSTFWNYELNIARKLNLEAGGKINFYRLKPSAQKEVNDINNRVKELKNKLEPSQNLAKVTENINKIHEFQLQKLSVETALTLLVLQGNSEKDRTQTRKVSEDPLKMQAYAEEEFNLKKEIEELKEAINELRSANEHLNREYYEREAEISQVEIKIDELKQRKRELCALGASWEEIPFEQLQFKGLTVKHQPFTAQDKPTEKPLTVAHMLRVGEILKKRLNERRIQKEEAIPMKPGRQRP